VPITDISIFGVYKLGDVYARSLALSILESPDVRVGPDPTKFSGADPIGPGRNREIYPIADRRQFAVRIKLAAARRRHIIDFLLGVCTENLNPDVVVMKSAKDRV
jgi:hypothetical protein